MRWWLLALPGLLAAAGLKSDIEFTRRDGVALLLDEYIPDGAEPFPAVIWVHGGGFVSGDKKPAPKGLLEPLEARGYAWFSVNYRLSPKYTFPAQTDDVESAVAYVKAHARELKVDRNKLVLMGASAGGHLVSFVGARHARGNGVAAVVSFFGEHDLADRVHPRGACMMDGKVVESPGRMCLSPGLGKFLGITAQSPNAEAVLHKASPATYVKKGMPPYLLIHGTKDFAVPFEQSEQMVEAMSRVGAKCDLIRVEGGGHGFGAWDKDPAMAGYKQRMLDWLHQVVH